MQNGSNHHPNLIEFTRIGLIHSPSGRLLTSENFQGSLNVQGTTLKRKQIWTLYVEAKNPTAFFLQNHLGNFLSADKNGRVSLVEEEPGTEERFLIQFDQRASGEIAIQSEAHHLYLQWTGTEMRCFSKEPVWWGMRLGMHPQVHLRSVHRNCFVRSAKKDTELRAVTKMPCSSKFLLWLQQLPLPSATASCSKGDVARLSRVAIRTQSGRFLRSDSTLVDCIEEATLFAVSFKPSASQVLMFQDEKGEYLTVGAGGVLKVKMGGREPRREEFFSIETPTNQVRIWANNSKFACDKHGLSFSTTMEETEEHKSTIYQLEYVGGRGLPMSAIVSAVATPSVDSTPNSFGFDGPEDGYNYLTTGLWRLRAQDGRLWQIPASGSAVLAPSNCEDATTSLELLYVPNYVEEGGRINARGGVVLCNSGGNSTIAKPLGALVASDVRPADPEWQPKPPEVLHLISLVNRTSIACYSPLACAFLASLSSAGSSARRPSIGTSSMVDCTSCVPQQWFLRHLIYGTVQFMIKEDNRWMMLTAPGLTLTPSEAGPEEADPESGRKPETEFVICMGSEKYALIRALVHAGGQSKPAFLTTNLQGVVKLESTGVVSPGCIWQL